MLEDKINKNDYRFIEKILYEYKTYESAIEALTAELDEIMPSGSVSIIPFSHNQGNKRNSETEKVAIKRLESPHAMWIYGRLEEKRRHKRLVEQALQALTAEEKEFIRLKYSEERPHRYCWEILYRSKTSYFQFKNKVITKIAKSIGLL